MNFDSFLGIIIKLNLLREEIMNRIILAIISVFIIVIGIISTQVTIFVIQPIGMLPEGKTLIISKLNKTKFVDSADGICLRTIGEINLLCRGAVLAAVINHSHIILKLPYSEFLYKISTGGKEFEK
jgi:hypothetical protein